MIRDRLSLAGRALIGASRRNAPQPAWLQPLWLRSALI